MSKHISQPNHSKLVLSTATATVEENSEGGAVFITPTNPTMVGALALDANDSVRLAAFLNRFYIEQGQAEQKAEADAVRKSRAARAERQQAARLVK